MVQLESGALPEGLYLGLWKLGDLRGIREADDGVRVGALTTYTEILASDRLGREYPLLGQAARETGGVATQIAAPSAAISPTRHRPRTRRRRCWSTTPSSN